MTLLTREDTMSYVLASSWRSPRPVTTISLLVATLAGVLLAVGGATLTASPAQALCAQPNPPLTGTWRNIDQNTNSITRVDYEWGCGDQTLCDENGHCSTPTGWIRAFGRCHPTDCDWGRERLYAQSDGWERAIYRRSWATKYVWVKPYSYYGKTYLRVWVNTDFHDGRQDYTTDVWMLK